MCPSSNAHINIKVSRYKELQHMAYKHRTHTSLCQHYEEMPQADTIAASAKAQTTVHKL